VTLTRDRERISALTAGLGAAIITWTFVAAYAPASLEAMGNYSPWLYGPAVVAQWAIFTAIASLILRRKSRGEAPSNSDETYRSASLHVTCALHGASVCANRAEKDRLAAVTAGFGLTITTWVAALSFMPGEWLDALSAAPPWLYCLASIVLWAGFTGTSHAVFRGFSKRGTDLAGLA
jgi:ABC-type transport system involved in cytochrome c biogenesis permease subunit